MAQISATLDKPAQYLAEYICLREAHKRKINLPEKFWNLPEWKIKYKQAIIAANKLLKTYDIRSILYALEKIKWCYSLHLKKLIPLMEEKEAELDKKNNTPHEIIDYQDNTLSKPRQNTQSKLRDLD